MSSDPTIPKNNRILVVDDNPAIHEDFRKILAAGDSGSEELEQAETALFGEVGNKPTTADYDLAFASQGEEALEKVKESMEQETPFGMAFVDVRMPPGWDGVQTTIQLWRVAPDLQIVICTAYSDYSWDEMVEKVGHSDRLVILKKPFDNVEVLQLASAMTEKWRLQQEAKIRLDELEEIINARTADLRNSINLLQQNVVNHQRTEERLRKSEERFKLIADNAADLIMVLDTAGKPEYFSPSVRHKLGHDIEDCRGRSVFDLFHADDREKTMGSVLAATREQSCQLLEFKIRHKSGAWRHIEGRVCAIREKTEDQPHLVIVGQDLSEKKEMESQTAFLTKKLLDARETPPEDVDTTLATKLESPLKTLSDRIQFVRDAFDRLTPILDEQNEIAAKAAEDVSEDARKLKSELPRAITESLENVEQISKMIADLKETGLKKA